MLCGWVCVLWGRGSVVEAPGLSGFGSCSVDKVAGRGPILSVVAVVWVQSFGVPISASLGASWLCSSSLNLSFSIRKTGAPKEYRRGERGRGGQCKVYHGPSASPAQSLCSLPPTGPPLEEAPAVLDKQDIVYVVEGQPACVTVTFNHVEAQVVWRR